MENNVVDDDDDNEFGDLYADVELQASSAINAVQLRTEVNDDDIDHNNCNNGETEECESESEDDLNIVLNGDDDDDDDFLNEDEIEENGGFNGNVDGNCLGQNSNGSENSKYARPLQAAFSSHLKGDGPPCVHSYATALVKGKWEDNDYTQRTGSRSAPQIAQIFSLPWSRNILDVNIDMFEKKPWRHPSADLTDYFNFGFDEDSWRQYCNCLPKGRAIEVQESIMERQPSTYLECSHDRDSTVVIQIALQDSVDDPISSPKAQCGASENGDIGEDGRGFPFSTIASKDELPSLEGTGGGSGSSTSERNTSMRECVSMDSDNYENCEFSEADEHHHQEGPDCDVDQTFGAIKSTHDAKESKEGEVSNPRNSIMLREPLHGEDREHSPGASFRRSHGESSGDGALLDFEKSHDHVRSFPSSESELRKNSTNCYQPLKVSKTHHIRTSGGSKYFTRGRRFVQRDLLHDGRPCRMSETNPVHLQAEDPHKSDAEILYERCNSTAIQLRGRDRQYDFDSHESGDTSHFKGAKPFYRNAGRFSYPSRFSCTENSERECQLNSRYYKNWHRSRSAKRKLDHLELSTSTDDELPERDRPHYGSRLDVQEAYNVAFHEPQQLVDKYISYLDDEKASPQLWKRDQWKSNKKMWTDDLLNVNKRMRTDGLVTECNYIYDIIEETDDRYSPYGGDTNILEDGYHVNLTYFRRETKSPRRGKRRDDSLCSSLDNLCCTDLNNEEGRFDGYQPPSFRLCRETCTASRRWQSPVLPHGRHRISSRTRRCQDNGQFADLTSSMCTDQTTNYPGSQDKFDIRRGSQQSEGLQWVEDENSSWYQQKILDTGRLSCSVRRTSSDRRFESFDNKHEAKLVGKLVNDKYMDQERYKLMREGNNASQLGQGSKSFHKDNQWRRFPRWRDSVASGSVVDNRESSGWSKAGSVASSGRYSELDSDSYVELKPIEGAQQEEPLIEEGQIISEETNEKTIERKIAYPGKSQISETKISSNDKKVEGQDNPRIMEIMAKMEKRRERFKQPVALKSDSGNVSKPSIDSFAGTTGAMQPRPARKRRWV